jgi:glycosyltransferase involved in cell wall biosynthesis
MEFVTDAPGPDDELRPGRPSWVVIPARDEADRVGAALAALRRAAADAPGDVHVVVVDDGSRDATAAVARTALADWPGQHAVIDGPAAGVGWARRTGIEHATEAASEHWDALIATTDADSAVSPQWLAALHRRLDQGHGVVAGDVHLDPSTDPRLVAARATRLRARLRALPWAEAADPHPHFAGSSLGFTLDALQQLGPLPTPPSLEDDAILRRCRLLGIPFVRDADAVVVTSSRLRGRASDGLADALARDLLELEPAPPAGR